MDTLIGILGCPLCKLGLDEMQARAMEYSIYLMLGMIYSLAGIFGFKVIRMMNREEREMALKQAAAAQPAKASEEKEAVPTR